MSRPHDNGKAQHDTSCAWSGSAQEFVAGGLDAERHAAFRAHVDAGCAACDDELRLARELQADFDAARFLDDASLPAPPASLKQRVLDAIRGHAAARHTGTPRADRVRDADAASAAGKHDDELQTWRRWREPDGVRADGLRTQRAGEGAWESTSCPGVSVRQLSLDAAARQCTMMVRMEPGSSYPPHRHGGAEECFVVAGDLHVGDEVLTAGDFQRAEEGSIHGVQSTQGGCTLLIVSSLDDELLPVGD